MLYRILLFAHVASVVAFLLFHGATASVMFAMKRAPENEQIKGLLAVRKRIENWWGIPMMLLLITGVALAFMGRWWGHAWVWISIGLFVVILFAMSGFGRLYLDRIAHAIDPDQNSSPMKNEDRGGVKATQDELATLLRRGRPAMLSVIGIVGLALILWLMMFKPF